MRGLYYHNAYCFGGPAILNSTGTVLTIADDPDGAIQTSGTVTLNGTAFTSITNSGDLTFNTTATLSGDLNVTAGTVTLNDVLSASGAITNDGTIG